MKSNRSWKVLVNIFKLFSMFFCYMLQLNFNFLEGTSGTSRDEEQKVMESAGKYIQALRLQYWFRLYRVEPVFYIRFGSPLWELRIVSVYVCMYQYMHPTWLI